MSTLAQCNTILEYVDQAVSDGTRYKQACNVIGIAASTLRRWRPTSGSVRVDRRPEATRPIPFRRLSDEERKTIVETCNRAEFASLPPSQIVPILADRGEYIGSESTVYRELKRVGQLNHRGRAKVRQKRGAPTTHLATAINQVWMMIESMFRTLKYSPRWSSQGFESLEAARRWANIFMAWYNNEHKHSALKFATPAQRHRGEDVDILANRHQVYQHARATNPQRWSGETRNWQRESVMTLNPEKKVAAVS